VTNDPVGVYIENAMTDCERQYLIIYNHDIRNFDYETFRAFPIMITPVQKFHLGYDHFFYWALAADFYQFLMHDIKNVIDYGIQDRLRLLMDFLFLRNYNPEITAAERKIDDAIRTLNPRYLNILTHSTSIVSHLAYPIIEGLARRLLPEYVDPDGKVKTTIEPFTCPDGVKVNIVGKRISSISTIMRLLETKTADTRLQSDLAEFRNAFETAYSLRLDKGLPYDQISDLRNSLLHGEDLWQTINGSLINLICILINSQISEEIYNLKHAQFLSEEEREMAMKRFGHGFNESYYPPF
jgi:hypothetical protein